jgi:hypothetical protein
LDKLPLISTVDYHIMWIAFPQNYSFLIKWQQIPGQARNDGLGYALDGHQLLSYCVKCSIDFC